MRVKLFLALFVVTLACSAFASTQDANKLQLNQLQQAAIETSDAQTALALALSAPIPDPSEINRLRNEVKKNKANEIQVYQALVNQQAGNEYNQALAAQQIVVTGQAGCQRIDSEKECLLKAEQAALSLAAKQGGHYFIEANSQQTSARQKQQGYIHTSSQFNETVSMQVKAHVLGFVTTKKKIEKSPYSTHRQASVTIEAKVAGQQNPQLKQSLLQQAQAQYKRYLSSHELASISAYPQLTLPQLGLEFVALPAGQFNFGSLQGDRNEKPRQRVNVASFYLSRLEVTKHIYNQCIKSLVCSREAYVDDLTHPAVELTWLEITEEFIPWLANETGYQVRLPTEVEWEYATASGAVNAPLCTLANGRYNLNECDDEYPQLAPVGMLKANKYGIYDLQGNAAEWTQSCWQYDHKPTTTAKCRFATIKGGSWYNKPYYMRPSARFGKRKTTKLDTLGFRLALTLAQ